MRVQKIGKRSLVFTYPGQEWNLNLHVILGDRYNYVIDTGLGPKSVAPLKKHFMDRPVIVVNTHFHWDHVWGNCAFPGSLIISHKLCRELIESRWDEMLARNRRYVAGNVSMRLPDMTFEGSVYFEDDGIKIVHTPGHTMDCISVLDERDRILNAGDNIGDTTEEIVPSLASTKEEYISTLKIYKGMEFDACISGHNEPQGSDIADRILAALR